MQKNCSTFQIPCQEVEKPKNKGEENFWGEKIVTENEEIWEKRRKDTGESEKNGEFKWFGELVKIAEEIMECRNRQVGN